MIDIAVLATSAVTTLIPYLVKGGESIAGETGKNLYVWLKEKLYHSNKEKDIDAFKENPNDLKLQGKIEAHIENILKINYTLVPELLKLVQDAKEEINKNSIKDNKNVVNAPITSGGHSVIGDNNNVS